VTSGQQAEPDRGPSLARSGIAMASGTLAASDRARQRHRGFQAGLARAGLPAGECLRVIGEEILDVLDSHADPHEAVGDPDRGPLLGSHVHV
jgi:hypothetical protein